MKPRKATYHGEREVRPFADLNHATWVMIDKTERDEQGSYYTIMAAILFSAFSFEAYLNHLGRDRFPFWENIDSIRVMDKYACLSKHLGISPDFSKRPYQTLSNVFKFRNSIAHGKTEIVKQTRSVSADADLKDLTVKAKWEEYCTLANARRAKEDVEAAIRQLHAAAGLGEHPFMFGMGAGHLSYDPV